MPVVDADISARNQIAFRMASENSKQVLTLATAVATVTITFSQSLSIGNSIDSKRLMTIGWALLALSVLSGVQTLLAITGSMGRSRYPTIYGLNVRIPAAIQLVSFALAILLFVVTGSLALLS